jgi:hypothetical protein
MVFIVSGQSYKNITGDNNIPSVCNEWTTGWGKWSFAMTH